MDSAISLTSLFTKRRKKLPPKELNATTFGRVFFGQNNATFRVNNSLVILTHARRLRVQVANLVHQWLWCTLPKIDIHNVRGSYLSEASPSPRRI
jgi:hypothetical protein